MSTLLIATRSADKLREIRNALGQPAEGEILDLTAAGISPDPAEDDLENLPTFEENALSKARYFSRVSGLVTLADDSGLCVDALAGAPGVRSKRLSGRADLKGRELDEANNQRLLELIRDVPPDERTAHYTCALALVAPGGAEAITLGHCHGRLLDAPRGKGGFGYDPLFLLPDRGQTFGETPPEVKADISHRAHALRSMRETLRARVDDFGVLL